MSRQITIIKTQAGKDAIVIDGYVYNWTKNNKDTKRYRCRYTKSNCSASVTILNDETIADRIVRINENHDHPPTSDDTKLMMNQIIADMKISAEIEDKSLQDIYEDGLLEFKGKVGDDEEKILMFPEFENLKSTLYLHQKKNIQLYPHHVMR